MLEGRWLELAADFSKFRKGDPDPGYVTLIRSDYGQALIITKGMFKTAPDINGDELVYYALEDTVIGGPGGGSVLVEAEGLAGARYNE